jgi:DNA-binding helix-hairpin-helix protein with protein kinase domain/Flp pilus assembly protein TadD
MLTYYDSKNQPYILTNVIGSGGEGTVYSCPNDKTVAKIYHEPITDEKAEKLRWMAGNVNEQLLKAAAWIVDTLHDEPNGKVVGFLMPNVRAKEIHELYSLKSRRVYFPEATWQFLVHTAANLARAFYNLHKNEHIMGDVNHGNCVVLADATVKLIDCDSYSIKLENRRYPCEVGVSSHLAPELQGVNLRDVERHEKHDNFGLAVIIFQLLFLGRHPFAGNYVGGEDKSLEDCIREHRFAYGKDALLRNVKQPPGTLSLDAVSTRIAALFERAFLSENRPEPREWIEALEDLSNNLKSCAMHPGHHYYKELHLCPWCEIEGQTGLMLFPFVSSTNRLSDSETFNIFTVENLVASFDVRRNIPALPVKPAALPPEPSFKAHSVKKRIQSRFIILAITQFLVTAFFVYLVGGCTVFIPTMLILIVCITSFNTFAHSQLIDLEVNLDVAKRNQEKFEKEWKTNAGLPELNNNLSQIKRKIYDYQHLPKESRQKINLLYNTRFQRELNDHLSSFRLTDNQIPGIGEKRLGVLRNFGVKTAADIEVNRLRSIPGTGEVTAQKLLEWRTNLEKNFQYVPDAEISKAEQEQVELEFSEARRRIEQEIGKLLVVLRSASVKVQREQQQLAAKAETIAKELVQAENDFASVALKAPAMITMIVIAFFMVIFGNLIHLSPPPTSSTADYKTAGAQPPLISVDSNTSAGRSGNTGYDLSEDITDDRIAEMSDHYRKKLATDLYHQSLSITDNLKAEQKLKFALRYNTNDPNIINRLATVLYEQKRYEESLETSEQTLKIDSKNFTARTYIGMNYIMMKKYSNARRIFTELTRENPDVNSAFYNLGLAHKGLEDYSSAANAFRTAAKILPDDSDSHYELGFCLYKIGDKKGAQREYQTLLGIDAAVAEKLKHEAKKFN